jgi:hypothetical protein
LRSVSRASVASPGGKDEDDTILRDVMVAAVSKTTPRQVALKMQKTRELPLSGDPVKAIEVLAHRQPPPTTFSRQRCGGTSSSNATSPPTVGWWVACMGDIAGRATMGRVTARTRKTFKGAHHMGSAVPTVLPPYASRPIATDADANPPASAGRVRQFTAP